MEAHAESEFMNFQIRMKEAYPDQLGELNTLILEIGKKYGAKTNFFRPERRAFALPPKPNTKRKESKNYGLRLYCLRLSDSVVILFNGDMKTTQKVGECKNCRPHFDLANRITAKIDEALIMKRLVLSHRRIFGMENFEEEL